MKYRDLRYKHINENTIGDVLYVSFSTRASNGLSSYFGEKFFLTRNLDAFLIAQNGVNHWWHTQEILQLAEHIKKYAVDQGKKIILYGASMGGYAACHYRKIFNSSMAIALAPQIYIDNKYHPEQNQIIGHKVALQEKQLLQDHFIFDEQKNLQDQTSWPLLIFYDQAHLSDKSHITCYQRNIPFNDAVRVLDVPHANHDVARTLNKSGVLAKILSSIDLADRIALDNIEKLLPDAYLSDSKAFLNFLRKSPLIKEAEFLNIFDEYYKEVDVMDFESLYMAAEILMKLGRYEEAINISLQSIELYMSQTGKSAPEYLRNKFKFVVKKALNVK